MIKYALVVTKAQEPDDFIVPAFCGQDATMFDTKDQVNVYMQELKEYFPSAEYRVAKIEWED